MLTLRLRLSLRDCNLRLRKSWNCSFHTRAKGRCSSLALWKPDDAPRRETLRAYGLPFSQNAPIRPPWLSVASRYPYLDCSMAAQRSFAAPRGMGVVLKFSMLAEVKLVAVPFFGPSLTIASRCPYLDCLMPAQRTYAAPKGYWRYLLRQLFRLTNWLKK